MTRIFVFEYLTGLATTDADAPAELYAQGLAMRDAVAADLVRARRFDVSVAAGAEVPGAPLPASTVRPRPGEAAAAFVARQAARHELCWIIAPESDAILATMRGAVDEARWIGCSLAAIEVATSKRATLLTLAAAGLATPLAFDHAERTHRWVVKPDDGAGALDTRVHATLDAARADLAQRRAAATLEAWVDGDPLSLSLLCGHDGVELLSVNRQHVSTDPLGMVHFNGVTHGAVAMDGAGALVLQRFAERIHAALPGLRGFVGVDLVWHRAAGPVVIEVNPRVTSAYAGLSARLRRNLAADVVAAHAEELAHA